MNGAVYDADHLLVLSELALPEQVDRFFGERAKLGKELEDAAASLDYLEVGVLAEDDIEDALREKPISQVVLSDELGRLQVQGSAGPDHIEVRVLRLLEQLLPVLNLLNHELDFRDTLKPLLKVGASEEPEGYIELVNLDELGGLNVSHGKSEEFFHVCEYFSDGLFVNLFEFFFCHVGES